MIMRLYLWGNLEQDNENDSQSPKGWVLTVREVSLVKQILWQTRTEIGKKGKRETNAR